MINSSGRRERAQRLESFGRCARTFASQKMIQRAVEQLTSADSPVMKSQVLYAVNQKQD